MSLNEITRNSYQNGISAKKWLSLCKLFASKTATHSTPDSLQIEMCNSVLALLSSYPGDATLRRYLQVAIDDGFLPLYVYTSCFLLGVRSTELHDGDTLDMLCRVALDAPKAAGKEPIGSILPFGVSHTEILNSIQLVFQLVKTAGSLPITLLHPLYNSTAELLLLLVTCVSDYSAITASQAFSVISEATPALTILRLSPARPILESFVFQLLQVTDDSRLPGDAQLVHSQQFTGSNDIIGPSSDSDIVSFGLLFNSWLFHRGREFGVGDGSYATAQLIAFHRWSSWNPMTFYKQLLHSAVSLVAQANLTASGGPQYQLTRAFVIGRLPSLLTSFEKKVEVDGVKPDWRGAMHFAVTSLFQHHNLMQGCDPTPPANDIQNPTTTNKTSITFMAELIHQLSEHNLVENSFVATVFPNHANDFQSKLRNEAQDANVDLKLYLTSKLLTEANDNGDVDDLIRKIWKDPSSHSTFSEVVVKRFTHVSVSDVESLSHLCKVLRSDKNASEILSLHVKLATIASTALALLEDFECETVGDPQTAVTHLGEIVLFVQSILARYNLAFEKLAVYDRKLNINVLLSAKIIYREEDLRGPEISSFKAWTRAVFDNNSEGIEDGILRSAPPRTLLKIAGSLVLHAIRLCHDRVIDKDTLNNGISYFTGPLLNWTLSGVITVLLSEIYHRRFYAPVHLDVLQQLVTSPEIPQTVLQLSAGLLLRTFTQTAPIQITATESFDPAPIRRVAIAALGIPEEALTLKGKLQGEEQSLRQIIRKVFTDAATGNAPSMDIEHCLALKPPTQFLPILYSELTSVRQVETPRRIATHVLVTPRPTSSPPLLPIFLHVTLPTLIASMDHVSPPEQAIAAELLVAIISSALTAALHTEWAFMTLCNEQRILLGQTTTALARRLGGDLRRKANGSPMSDAITKRLTSSHPFVSNFPSFLADS